MTTSTRHKRELKRLTYELKIASRQVPYLRAMVEGTRDLLIVVDLDGQIIEQNQAALQQLAGDNTLTLRRHISECFFMADVTDSPMSPRTPLLSVEDLRLAMKEPSRHWGILESGAAVELDLSGLSPGDEAIVVISARLMNIDDERERELLEARTRLREMSRTLRAERQREQAARFASLATLAGALSHDLNNALAVVCGNLELLQEITTDEDVQEMLTDIQIGTESARELAQRFTTFSKGPSPILSPLDVTSWLSRLTRAFGSSHGVAVNLEARDETIEIAADEYQLTQAVLNLLLNALQAAGKDRPIDVVISSDDAPRSCTITVLDRGPGINEADQDRVFDPFFTTKPGGTGLGLASARRVVQDHDGQLRWMSRPGGGTRFEIQLPSLLEDNREGHPASAPDSGAAHERPTDSLENVRVVVMDDEPTVLQTITRMLRSRGAEVHAVTSGEDLLALAAEHTTRWAQDDRALVYVLDILIRGGLGGIETLRLIRKNDETARAIACSGHAPIEVTEDFRMLGFAEFLAKPFKVTDLIKAILRLSEVNPGPPPTTSPADQEL